MSFLLFKLQTENRRAQRRWQQSRNPEHETVFNIKTKRLRREIQKLKENSTYNNFLQMKKLIILSEKQSRGLKDL